MFAFSLYIAVLLTVSGGNVVVSFFSVGFVVIACFILTSSYAIVFVIFFHFHVQISEFFERSFGIPQFIQQTCLRFSGYIFALSILVGLIILHSFYYVSLGLS